MAKRAAVKDEKKPAAKRKPAVKKSDKPRPTYHTTDIDPATYPPMPPPRVPDNSMLIGAHVGISGGIPTIVERLTSLGEHCNAAALFVGSSRSWKPRKIEDKEIDEFKEAMDSNNISYDAILPHAPYICNLGSLDPVTYRNSVERVVKDLQTIRRLGVRLYNIHPGTVNKGATKPETVTRVAEAVTEVLGRVPDVIMVLETTSGSKYDTKLGGCFEDMADIIKEVDPSVRDRVKVCIDTQHSHAWGHSVQTKEGWLGVLSAFDSIVGLDRLCAFHINDSLTEKASRVDKHAPLGGGTIGWGCFEALMSLDICRDKPLIIETPDPSRWPREIEALHGFGEIASLRAAVERDSAVKAEGGLVSLTEGEAEGEGDVVDIEDSAVEISEDPDAENLLA
ncbi:AP endonuclease 2 [Kipferlia bialata]|uniref:AP endonuclease 2 n=1 Tax=Kipferlia bialata TaxID=797122 RepID=A0A9K3CQA4_9EUKA|nr:AP endonuclease 2 [Kipferlia bialata]|eukprot:g1153.t1